MIDTIFMKTTGKYPDWVDQYRGHGRTVKKLKNGYALYSCTSQYVKGGKPKSVQKYLGMISEKDGFIPKSVPYNETVYIEFGLSRFIVLNYHRDLQRSVHGPSEEIILLAVIRFMFGSVTRSLLSSSALTRDRADELYDYYTKISPLRINNLAKKISSFLEDSFPDDSERAELINGLKLCVIPADKPVPSTLLVPEPLAQLISKHGLIYGC